MERMTSTAYLETVNAEPKPNKYRNIKTDGFDSKKERDRYHELLLLEKCGAIEKLETQKKFLILPGSKIERPVFYIADFFYIERNRQVVEDVKGVKTPLYILKRKLMRFVYPDIEFREIMDANEKLVKGLKDGTNTISK